MGGGSPRLPSPPPPPPEREDPAIAEARAREVVAARRLRGRASQILTGPQGVTAPAPVGRKVLLGQ